MNIFQFNKHRFNLTFLLLSFGLVWLSFLNLVQKFPPIDNTEHLIWSQSLEWSYYKHPPITTWVYWIFAQIFGNNILTTYLLGSLCTLTSIAFFWKVIKEVKGYRYASIAVLATLCITFYSGSLNAYNHNILLMLCVSLTALTWLKIIRRPHFLWWTTLGLLSAAGLLTKYQYCLVIFAGVFIFIHMKMWRLNINLQGLALAGAITIILLLPHANELFLGNDHSMNYACSNFFSANIKSDEIMRHNLIWTFDWFLNRSLPCLIFLIAFVKLGRLSTLNQSTFTQVPSKQSWILLFGAMPFLGMLVMGIFFGVNLRCRWATAFSLWMVPIFMEIFGVTEERLSRVNWKSVALKIFLLIQITLVWLSFESSTHGFILPDTVRKKPFPYQELASALEADVSKRVGVPIQIVSANDHIAGALNILLEDKPLFILEHNNEFSPWINKKALFEKHIIHVWAPNEGPLDANPLMDGWRWTVSYPINGEFQ